MKGLQSAQVKSKACKNPSVYCMGFKALVKLG